MDRRKFIQITGGLVGLGSGLYACRPKKRPACEMVDNTARIGHILRNRPAGVPESQEDKEIVIVGAGISGLSAAYEFEKKGMSDYLVLELDNNPGGNSGYSKNEISAFPLGAHYIPIPNTELTEYLHFLEKSGIILGKNESGDPIYNEAYLCFDPQERLFINGQWQEGLVPNRGVPNAEQAQIDLFLKKMQFFREAVGADGKQAFTIPVDESSQDLNFSRLDLLTMQEWMEQNGFTSRYLHRYVNYCCRDDFGTPHQITSAWVGIHYFASRKGRAANAASSDVLTWPQGNGFLVDKLADPIRKNIRTGSIVLELRPEKNGWSVVYLDLAQNKQKAVRTKKVILAIPQFVVNKLLPQEERTGILEKRFHYAPWLVANMKVKLPLDKSPVGLSWDNVIHESDSLGYVYAGQQLLDSQARVGNITYYQPLTEKDPVSERTSALNQKPEEWLDQIIRELKPAHPDILEKIESCTLKVWGHAMVQPRPGMIFGHPREKLKTMAPPGIYFAHTDLAGISIFEEAFYQGLNAAKECLKHL